MTAYYNEHDKFAAAWLHELIKAGLIAPGDVDERSIEDVKPKELVGYTQCHFFAGIGGWSLALRQAGWPDDRPVWTGSCPCQPFSAAGKGGGTADERHLWPAFFHLIEQCQPGVVFGEQVEAAIKHGWLDLVQADLEGIGYAFGAVGLPAAGIGAPHIRARLWFVAESDEQQRDGSGNTRPRGREQFANQCGIGELADSASEQFNRESGFIESPVSEERDECRSGCTAGELGDPNDTGPQGRPAMRERAGELTAGPSGLAGFWTAADWLPCRDGKARPVEPAIERLADGLSADLGLVRLESYPGYPHEERLIYSPLIQKGKARVGRLRGYGNAIVPQVAQEIIRAYMRCA